MENNNGNIPPAAESSDVNGDSQEHALPLLDCFDLLDIAESSNVRNPSMRLNQHSQELNMGYRFITFPPPQPRINAGNLMNSGAVNFSYPLRRFSNVGESSSSSSMRIQNRLPMQYPNSRVHGGLNFGALSVNNNLNSWGVLRDGVGSSKNNNTNLNLGNLISARSYNYQELLSSRNPQIYANQGNNYHNTNTLTSVSSLSLQTLNPQPWPEKLGSETIYLMAMNSEQRLLLEEILEEGNHAIIGAIIKSLKYHIHELMVHEVGNSVIQKLFKVCSEEQMSELLWQLLKSDSEFLNVCSDLFGLAVAIVFCVNAVGLTNKCHTYDVIEHFLESFSHEEYKLFIEAVAINSTYVCTNKNGCSVIQKIIHHVHAVNDLSSWRLFTSAIICQAVQLAQDQYGNYVVQYLVKKKIPEITLAIVTVLLGSFVLLSSNKFGSNVVEECLRSKNPPYLSEAIIKEISESSQFLSIINDQFGNYVAQTMLDVSKGKSRYKELVKYVKNHYVSLHSHIHGSKVWQKMKELERARRLKN
ncbi:pumilio homolog 15-like [Andrographis paniculata]|uniref:pumilio homolog 15-like n=1 Tax=Andrographis paniculata TaxID=175694 RepID=UPI0021E70D07|nr:pumilio homolog 15-like [Andrographis paniculata]